MDFNNWDLFNIDKEKIKHMLATRGIKCDKKSMILLLNVSNKGMI